MAYNILIENILKGIVVSHAKNGVQLDQIKDEFMEHAGELCPTIDANELKNYLRGINGLYRQGHSTWYAGKPSHADKNTNLHMPNANEQVVRHIPANAFHTQSNENVNSHGPVDQNNNNNCSAGTKITSNDKLRTNSNNTSFRTSVRSGSTRGNTRRPNRYSKSQKIPHYETSNSSATFYDHELVGDDFFLAMAKVELNCVYDWRGKVCHCGLCVSGQTIKSAAKRLRYCSNIKIILNVGSVDLLHGRDFVDMRGDFMQLMQICKERNIQVIITTLAPLANKLDAEDLRPKYDAFNKFLIQTYSRSHKVIDIKKCMVDPRSQKVIFECYQPFPAYVSGSNQPHLLWNRIGRQRVLKCIKSRIGI